MENREIEYERTHVPETTEKKGKQGKNPPKVKDNQPQITEENINFTKEIKSCKTFRQKFAYSYRNKNYELFKQKFEKEIINITEKFEKIEKEETKFQFNWEKTVFDLTNEEI